MAFSGQYAAAQLHHLPLPHSVIVELSDYLGYAPNFAPPTYVKFARVYGRLPDSRRGLCTCLVTGDDRMYQRCCRAEVDWRDFRDNGFRIEHFGDLRVDGFLLRKVGRDFITESFKVSPKRLTPALKNPTLHLHLRDEDIEFFRRWASATGLGAGYGHYYHFDWPDIKDRGFSTCEHPALKGALRIYNQYAARWYAYR